MALEALRLPVEGSNKQLVDILGYVVLGATGGVGVALVYALWIRRKSKVTQPEQRTNQIGGIIEQG